MAPHSAKTNDHLRFRWLNWTEPSRALFMAKAFGPGALQWQKFGSERVGSSA